MKLASGNYRYVIRLALLPQYDTSPQMGQSFQSPIVTAYTSGSVQHGMSAAGGVSGLRQDRCAADKR